VVDSARVFAQCLVIITYSEVRVEI